MLPGDMNPLGRKEHVAAWMQWFLDCVFPAVGREELGLEEQKQQLAKSYILELGAGEHFFRYGVRDKLDLALPLLQEIDWTIDPHRESAAAEGIEPMLQLDVAHLGVLQEHMGRYDFVLGVDFLAAFLAESPQEGHELRERAVQLFADVKQLLKHGGRFIEVTNAPLYTTYPAASMRLCNRVVLYRWPRPSSSEPYHQHKLEGHVVEWSSAVGEVAQKVRRCYDSQRRLVSEDAAVLGNVEAAVAFYLKAALVEKNARDGSECLLKMLAMHSAVVSSARLALDIFMDDMVTVASPLGEVAVERTEIHGMPVRCLLFTPIVPPESVFECFDLSSMD